ncbi:E3 ubiquitin-protein ligase TRIM45-like [Saccostrea echinata]|uniref:E3 ubiquitin-protein ligase TRIM45-like n=1 Tax=Saccostrea echinata TaxID=191078 RepID=UPI002A83542A|nr:E3 ubiquitin-protein ligase TRIM45-like [Saccostrea echinata]
MATPEDKDCVLKCPICLEKMKLPKQLPCLHTFCEQCIQSYVQGTHTGEEDERCVFQCPICRMEVTLPNISSTEWTQKLPTNHLMMSLIDCESTDSESKVIFCTPCKHANERNAAKYHCTDCKECYCEQCLTYFHKRKKDNNMHNVTNVDETTLLKSLEVGEACCIHANKDVEVFCFDHQELCCSICFVTKHRKCVVVKTLDEIENDENTNTDIEEFICKLDEIEKRTERSQKDVRENNELLKRQKEQLLQLVSEVVTETKSILDELHNEFVKSVEKTFSHAEQMQEFGLDCLNGFQKTLAECKKLTKAIQAKGSRKQMFVTKEKAKIAVDKHFERLEKTCYSTKTDYVIDIDEKIHKMRDCLKIATLRDQQSDKSSLKEIEEAVRQLGCLNNFQSFQHTFSVLLLNYRKGKLSSPSFGFQDMTWVVVCKRHDDALALFLSCSGDDRCTEWTCKLTVEFRIINSDDRGKDVTCSFTDKYSKDRSSLGIASIVDWKTLISENNGFIIENSITVVVRIFKVV